MAKYFNVSLGLRGAYMADTMYVIRCQTRRELKSAIENEAYYIRDAGYIGANKKGAIALAAHMWREAKKKNPSYLPDVLPYGTRENKHSAIHISVSNRKEYLDYLEQND